MSSIRRIGLIQTRNAYGPMPATAGSMASLQNRMEEIRRTNVAHHLELIREAASRGAQLIGLGELFTGPYFALHKDPIWRGLAEPIEGGPTVTDLQQAALQHRVVLVAPIYEEAPDGRLFNTAVVFDTDGTILGFYRKIHIPHGSNEGGQFLEGFYYEGSDGKSRGTSGVGYLPVFETKLGTIGVTICYDRHFEGLVSRLADQGAQLIFSPAVTFGRQSRRMWELEFLVDAARSRVFVAGSNRLGAEDPWNIEYFGASYVAGPNGRCLNISGHPELVISDVDLDEARESSDGSGWKLRSHRRQEALV